LAIENVKLFPSGSDAVGVNVYAVSCVAVVGGVPEMTGGRFEVAAVTAIENAGIEAVLEPSVTEILMFVNDPVVPAGGVPDSRPVLVSNAAQLGLPAIENVNVLPSGSLAVGTNVYAVPASTLVIGTPEITGGRFVGGGVTRIVKAGSGTATRPSLTEIVTLLKVPCDDGVPCSRPVLESNAAQFGRLRMENVSA
jgi:hypothetical protein